MKGFTDSQMKCFKCKYVGKFIEGLEVNKTQWKRNYLSQIFNHQDNYLCPVCGQYTTNWQQIAL